MYLSGKKCQHQRYVKVSMLELEADGGDHAVHEDYGAHAKECLPTLVSYPSSPEHKPPQPSYSLCPQ